MLHDIVFTMNCKWIQWSKCKHSVSRIIVISDQTMFFTTLIWKKNVYIWFTVSTYNSQWYGGNLKMSWPYFLAICSALKSGFWSLISLTLSFIFCLWPLIFLHSWGKSTPFLSNQAIMSLPLALALGASESHVWYDALSYKCNYSYTVFQI